MPYRRSYKKKYAGRKRKYSKRRFKSSYKRGLSTRKMATLAYRIIEKKRHTVNVSSTGIGQTPSIISLWGTGLSQGTTGSTFLGSRITITGVKLIMQLKCNKDKNVTHWFRILVGSFDSDTLPTNSQILQSSTNPTVSMYAIPHATRFKIFYDKTIRLGASGAGGSSTYNGWHATKYINFGNKTGMFSTTSAARPSNVQHFYMIMSSEASVNLPEFQMHSRMYFKDA